jgi:nitrilase
MGEIIAGPLYNKQGILYAELEMDDIKKAKVDFDVVGHYSRSDIFQFGFIK